MYFARTRTLHDLLHDPKQPPFFSASRTVTCRPQPHAQQVGKLRSCHHACEQGAHMPGSTIIAAPAPAGSAPATLVDRVGAEACCSAKMLNPNSCWSSCWQSPGILRPRCGQRCSCTYEVFSPGPAMTEHQQWMQRHSAYKIRKCHADVAIIKRGCQSAARPASAKEASRPECCARGGRCLPASPARVTL